MIHSRQCTQCYEILQNETLLYAAYLVLQQNLFGSHGTIISVSLYTCFKTFHYLKSQSCSFSNHLTNIIQQNKQNNLKYTET
jgi:hypothetical protein